MEEFPGIQPTLVHLLVAWARRDPDGELDSLLAGTGMAATELAGVLVDLVEKPLAEDTDLLRQAIVEISASPVTGRHLLQAICRAPQHRVSRTLTVGGLDLHKLSANLEARPSERLGVLARLGIETDVDASPLLRYGRDLTALAREGSFQDLCDRPREIERILEVLLRKSKGNVALTGSAGVGKTALVELLARMLANDSVTGMPANVRVFELRLGQMVAGTKYRGEFEQRLEEVTKAILACQPAIIFIDELHLLVGAGRAEGAPMDGANLLKPFLSRGTFRLIGATTVAEYHRYVAGDEALARRFQEIRLEEPDESLVFEMVNRQVQGLVQHHGVAIAPAIAREAIHLTNRHVPNRAQPDKTLDLVDSASVGVRRRGGKELVLDDLLETLSRQTGRPINALTGRDRASLRGLAGRLKKRIIGQDHAVEMVAATLAQRRQDLGPPDRGLGTFLFAGDTGVGKTELARTIAAEFFGDARSLLHLDMAEYSDLGGVNKLIGSAPGYVGSEKGGKLTAWLHSQGSGIIIFDEIEKAHPTVIRLLLGLLDNGRIASARGENMDSRQCVVILTTNAVTAEAMNRGHLGFKKTQAKLDPVELLTDSFPREFLGRLDEIILFNQLGDEQIRAILKLRLDEAIARLRRKDIEVVYEEDRILAYLLAHLKETHSGARGIARVLEQKLIQPIALAMLEYDGPMPAQICLDDYFQNTGRAKCLSMGRPPTNEPGRGSLSDKLMEGECNDK